MSIHMCLASKVANHNGAQPLFSGSGDGRWIPKESEEASAWDRRCYTKPDSNGCTDHELTMAILCTIEKQTYRCDSNGKGLSYRL